MKLDIKANRSTVNYSFRVQIARVLWSIVSLLFKYSPRNFFAFRRILLLFFGAKIGKEVYVYSSSRIYMPWNLEIGDWSSIGEDVFIYNLGRVSIGCMATISHRAQICAGTHDYKKPDLPLIKSPVVIKDQVWVCASSFIGPGVTVNEGAIVGACAVVVRDVEPWAIVAGNPCKVVGERTIEEA